MIRENRDGRFSLWLFECHGMKMCKPQYKEKQLGSNHNRMILLIIASDMTIKRFKGVKLVDPRISNDLRKKAIFNDISYK